MRRWLFVAGRHFGDAIISSRLIDALHASFPQDQFDLLTRKLFVPIFEGRGGVSKLWFSAFPHGGIEPLGFKTFYSFLWNCTRLRRERYDVALNDYGDIRDCLAGW